jgi:hypothetical protein
MLDIPKFKTKKELYDFLVTNKEELISQKKLETKRADEFGTHVISIREMGVNKSEASGAIEKDSIEILAVINTTNIMDSHKDVHIPGLWDKSLKENKRLLHVQEHKTSQFDKIISSGEDLKAYVKDYSWKELGFDVEGYTQALMFESKVKKSRNEYMFEQYSKGYVDNHSVGMRYVKLELAINDKDYEKEKDFFDKYIDQIVNRKEAEEQGYFWVVTEAKIMEGSAVPMGSNPITPTLAAKTDEREISNKFESALKSWLNL